MARIDLERHPARHDERPLARPAGVVARFAGDELVPRGLAVTSAVIVRLVIVLGGIWLIGLAVTKLLVIVIPLVIALLLATLFVPVARALERRGFPRALAALTAVAGGLLVLGGTLSVVIPAFVSGIGDLSDTVEQGVRQLGAWLAGGPLNLTENQINASIDRATNDLSGSGGDVARGVLTGALLATQVAASVILVVFLTFFFVKDGVAMWRWLTSLAAPARRPLVDDVGRRAWQVLTAYVHGVALVATVDAFLIGCVLLLLDIPLALPLIVLTFLAAFFPIVGALVAGAAAVLVALVTQGPAAALIVLVAIVVIQQLEGNVLYPVVVGRQLNLHPVAIVLALGAGAVVAGLAGAFLAVPLAAVVGAVINYARSAERLAHTALTQEELDVLAPGSHAGR